MHEESPLSTRQICSHKVKTRIVKKFTSKKVLCEKVVRSVPCYNFLLCTNNMGFNNIEGSKSSTHYLSYKNRFDVSSKGPSSGISVTNSRRLIPDEGPLLETSNLFLSLR